MKVIFRATQDDFAVSVPVVPVGVPSSLNQGRSCLTSTVSKCANTFTEAHTFTHTYAHSHMCTHMLTCHPLQASMPSITDKHALSFPRIGRGQEPLSSGPSEQGQPELLPDWDRWGRAGGCMMNELHPRPVGTWARYEPTPALPLQCPGLSR